MGCGCGNKTVPSRAAPLEAAPSQYQRRLLFCAGCDSLKRLHVGLPKGADVGLLDRCGECGCLVKAKALLPGQNCPLGLW